MKKLLFSAVASLCMLSIVSCKKEAATASTNALTQQKPAGCPEGSVRISLGTDPSTGNITGSIEMSWNNPFSTPKAVDITIDRIETGGNHVLFIHQLLGQPGSSTLNVDYLILPSNTIGLSYVINSYKTAEVKGHPCSVVTGCKYL